MAASSRRGSPRSLQRRLKRSRANVSMPERLEVRRLLAADDPTSTVQPLGAEAVAAEVSVPLAAFRVPWQGRTVHAVPGEFVFQYGARTAPSLPGGWTVRSLGTGSWLLTATGASEQQVVSWSMKSGVRNLEPNYLLKALGTPVDPEYPRQWHLPRINAPTAWDTTNGSASVVVAVIDSGIDYDHPDFSTSGTTDRKNIWQNPKEVPGNGIDDDNNGYIDDFYGYDFGANDSNPMDDDPADEDREDANIAELGRLKYTGHGTAVAGVMGAVAGSTDPQQMVAGVNWDLDMMALKITRPGVGYVVSAAVEAYKYIQKMRSQFNINIVVANCSWGTYDDNISVRNLEAEIEKAGGQDILTVAAAGDSGISIDVTPFYPAAFQSDYILSVAATNRNDTLWSGSPDWAWRDNDSNYGFRNVDVAAPGKEILTTISKFAAGGSAPGTTGNWEGTSMAAGIVSGVAALMKAASPTAPALSLKQVIINTVQKVAPLRGLIRSEGIVDAGAAVAEILLPSEPQIDILHLPGQEDGVFERHTGYSTATWQIRVRGPLDRDPRTLYVDYRTVDNEGSATPDGRRDPRTLPDQDKKPDYIPVIGTMAFASGPRIVDRLTQVGRTSVDVGRIRSVPVRVIGDRNIEQSETMRLRIDRVYYKNRDNTIQVVNNYILTRTNDFTIINDDFIATDGSDPDARTPLIRFFGNGGTTTPGSTGSTLEIPEGDTGTSIARFPVRLAIPTTNTVTVRYRTRDLDGRAGVDYVEKSGMVTFRPNVTEQFIDIPIIGNRIGQSNRSFQVELFDPTNGVLPGTGTTTSGRTATGVIIDDDAKISVAGTSAQTGIASVSVNEPTGSASTVTLPIELRLSQPVQQQASVRYSTRDLSARAGSDYVAASGRAVFAPGTSSATVFITILADTFVEGNEDFFLDLSQPTNAALATSSVRVTIVNSGATTTTPTQPTQPTVSASVPQVSEGNTGQRNAVFTLRLAAASASAMTVSYATANGTAVAGQDYVARSGSVRFAPGETIKTVFVPVIGNYRADGNRTFDLVVTSGTGSAARPLARTTATIVDDDAPASAARAFAALAASGPTTSVGAAFAPLGQSSTVAAGTTRTRR